MGGSFIYLWETTQGRGRSEGKIMPGAGLRSLGQGSQIRTRSRGGGVGQGQGTEFRKRKLRLWEGGVDLL